MFSVNRILIFAFSISSHILLSAVQAKSRCPLPSHGDNASSGKLAALRGSNSKLVSPDDGETGDRKSALLVIYNYEGTWNGTALVYGEEELVKELVDLEKGKEIDSNCDVNGHNVLVKFIGTEVCISYRDEEVTTGTTMSTESKCKSECFCYMEDETYFKNITCSPKKCFTHAEKKLKFVLQVSSGPRFAATMGVILGCVLTTAGVLF